MSQIRIMEHIIRSKVLIKIKSIKTIIKDNTINIILPFLNVLTLVLASKAEVIDDEYNLIIPIINMRIIVRL